MKKPVADLMEGFAMPSLADWQKAAEKSLKERPLSSLTKQSEDGLAVAPLYTPTQTDAPSLAPDNRSFVARPRIDLPDIDAAREQAAEDIANGCDGLVITTKGATAQPFGVAIENAKDVERFLDGFPAKKISVRLDTGNNLELTRAFLQTKFARVHTGFDFIGRSANQGEFPTLKKDFAEALALLDQYKPEGAGFVIDARLYHNAGASDAQELGFALATATENLRQMEQHGVTLETGLRRQSLLLSADVRQFPSIIKLRTMRLLWARFSEIITGSAKPVHMSIETSLRMLTAKDPATNLIRNTLAASAAMIGGAEKITVLPHTSALGLPDAFARRLARNTLNILREESHLAAVQDAARGASYVEEMTLQLAQVAWAIFQSVEKQGGIIAALQCGTLQSAVKEKRAARMASYRAEEKRIIGITAYQDPQPRNVAVLQKLLPQNESELALKPWRDAAAFEESAPKRKDVAA
ncbi:MAG: methylmalonyl-CoA mutase family protein [Pseudomonadota bacterium]